MIDTMNTHVGSEEEEEEEEEEEGGGEEGGEAEDGGEEGEGEREEVCVVGGEASSGQALLHVEIEANKTWVSFTIHNYCGMEGQNMLCMTLHYPHCRLHGLYITTHVYDYFRPSIGQ